MTDQSYKNIRVKEPTFNLLKSEKRDYETWDGFMHRAIEEVGDD